MSVPTMSGAGVSLDCEVTAAANGKVKSEIHTAVCVHDECGWYTGTLKACCQS